MLLLFFLAACRGASSPSAAGAGAEGPAVPVPSVFAVGGIVLADGTVVEAGTLTELDAGNPPIAVLAGVFQEKLLGVGVHRSETPLPWAAEGSFGYSARFPDLACVSGGSASFTGDLDGSDNWAAICAQDPAGTKTAREKYPAFDFSARYAALYPTGGDFASGWYIPSIAELCFLYENRAPVEDSLRQIHRLDHSAAMDGLGSNWYWSSSQANSADDFAWFVHYFNGYAGECPKNFENLHVLVIRAFEGGTL